LLRYGKLPFEQQTIFELYESIRSDTVDFEDEQDENFKDMITRILEKDPAKRIKMRDLRVSGRLENFLADILSIH
jgi:[calcium/calmodulin-dependent protein kinase] kinase